jgi:predicted DNA-binding transcriptional regulator AlpA
VDLLEVTLSRNRRTPSPSPARFHINKRARSLLAADTGGEDDEALSPNEMAALSGMSLVWLKKRRRDKTGPPFKKIGRSVRYPLGGYREWLKKCDQKAVASAEKAAERAAARARDYARERRREVLA